MDLCGLFELQAHFTVAKSCLTADHLHDVNADWMHCMRDQRTKFCLTESLDYDNNDTDLSETREASESRPVPQPREHESRHEWDRLELAARLLFVQEWDQDVVLEPALHLHVP